MKIKVLSFLLLSFGFGQVLCNPRKIFDSLYRGPPPPVAKSDPRVVTEGWIEQFVDNFDNNNNATYQMRYLANDEFYQPGGPIFIFVGGEWIIEPSFIIGGLTYDMAREMNGYLFYTEHRYYGLSHPTPDMSFENLQYLHINQALADLAHFIRTKKQEVPGASSSGVILVGGSYSATMVTWFRQRYPELINGAWSSSAPILAQIDFVEYFETVAESVRKVGGGTCYNALEGAFAEMERLVEVGEFEMLSEKFDLCSTMSDDQLDIWYFFKTLSAILAGVVQNHRPGDIELICSVITGEDTDIDGFATLSRLLFGECWNADYREFIEYFGQYSLNTSDASLIIRPWQFQVCNEFGWFQTSESPNQPFGTSFPLYFHLQWCLDLYSETLDYEAVSYNVYVTNLNNNGLYPVITNVYSTHGELDPWRPMGVQTDVNSFAPTVVIPMASHANDLESINDDDSPELRASKLRTISLVRQWLMIF